MAYNLLKAQGVTIYQESATPGTYTEIEGVKSISGFNHSTNDIDLTVLASTVKVFAPGVPDAGEIGITVYFDPDNTLHAALRAQSLSPASKNWKISITDGTPTSYTWGGYVKGFELSAFEVDGYLEATYTVKISGTVSIV